MKKIMFLLLAVSFCGCACNCEPTIKENEKLIVPSELSLPQPK